MCGIAGILQFRPGAGMADPKAVVARMNDSLRHRGPDADGLWTSTNGLCHLGHRRLSIIDLSAAANQPMSGGDGRYTLVFNGEVYNFKELRARLEARGVRFITHSDTEVLLEGFKAEGPAVFKSIDGMFAVAIYDSQRGTLTLARDAAGEKPLYYYRGDGFLAFASELRTLLTIPNQGFRLSEAGLALYMALRYVPPPHSIIKGVHKLAPGTVMQIGADGTSTETRFFSFAAGTFTAEPHQNPEAYAQAVEDAVAASLEARLNSDVPLGAFLSAGVDSALACAVLTKRLKQPLKTFTVGFEGDPGSEHTAAEDIARTLGTEHRAFIFGKAAFEQICDKIGILLDEPNGDRSCVPTYLLSQFAREHVTVAISGDGGDELFAGYARYLGFANAAGKQTWPGAADIVRAYFQNALTVFPWPAIPEVAPREAQAVLTFTDSFAPIFAAPGRSLLDAQRILDFETYMPGAVLAKVDRMSMRHGLEVRTPYLTAPLYDLSRKAGLPMLLGPEGQKATLRRLLARYLPMNHVTAPKKGFGMPPSVFLNNKERVIAELGKANAVLSEAAFFKERPGSAAALAKWAPHNTNSIWATIALAKWVESVGPSL
jgi:asparagine synthase (glutamine-hydrolysing)